MQCAKVLQFIAMVICNCIKTTNLTHAFSLFILKNVKADPCHGGEVSQRYAMLTAHTFAIGTYRCPEAADQT
jgi:hypothetical protein